MTENKTALEELKHKHKKEILNLQRFNESRLHQEKMQRLELILEIARLGGLKWIEKT